MGYLCNRIINSTNFAMNKTGKFFRILLLSFAMLLGVTTFSQDWVVVMTESDGDEFYLDDQYSFPFDWIQEKLIDYYFVKDITYDHNAGTWCVVVAEDINLDDQRIEMDYSFPGDWIADMWDQDYDLESVHFGAGQWVVVMTRGSGRTDDYWGTRESWADAEDFISDGWSDGLDILSLAYGDGLWAVAMAEADYVDQSYNWSYDGLPLDWIQDKYDDGFNVSSVVYAEDKWVVVMSDYGYQYAENIMLEDYFPENTISEYWNDGRGITTLKCGTFDDSYYYDDYYYDDYYYGDYYYDDYSFECDNYYSNDYYLDEFINPGIGFVRGLQFDMSPSEVARLYDDYDIVDESDDVVQTLYWIDDDYCEFYYVYHYFDKDGLYYVKIETFLGNEDTEYDLFNYLSDYWTDEYGYPNEYGSMDWWTAHDSRADVDYTITIEPVDVEGVPGIDFEFYRQEYSGYTSSNDGNSGKPGVDHQNGGNNNNNDNTTIGGNYGPGRGGGGQGYDDYMRLAQIELDGENWNDALDYYEKALDEYENDAAALCGKALCHIYLGECSDAMLDAYLAMNTDGSHLTTFTYGAALVCTGKCTDGLGKIDDALDMYEDALYYEYRAKAHECLGDKSSAVDDLEKAKDLNPSKRSYYQNEIDRLKPKNDTTNNNNNNNDDDDDDDIGRGGGGGRR